jgi:hypothetical protein
MDKDTKKFVSEGMRRYKQAAYVLVEFGNEVEAQLKDILNKRKEWGEFTPENNAQARSTTYWSTYPLLNSKLDGKFKGEDIKIVIGINWYLSKGNYPFYSVWIEPRDKFSALLEQYDWNSDFEFKENDLRFYPDENDFDLKRDFNKLLDEFVRFLNE